MKLQLPPSWNFELASYINETLLLASYKLKLQLPASWSFQLASYINETFATC